jgi:adenosylhomocysteine nucleosidase
LSRAGGPSEDRSFISLFLGGSGGRFRPGIGQTALRDLSGTYQGQVSGREITLYLTGIGKEAAREAGRKAAAAFPDVILSTGFSGSLNSHIWPGDLVLDASRSDPRLAEQLKAIALKKNLQFHGGKFHTSSAILSTSRQKLDLGRSSGAIAVDMETEALEQSLKARGIPLVFLRAVSDGAGQDLPPLEGLIDPAGKVQMGGVVQLLLRPKDWKSFYHLVQGSQKAGRSLAIILKEWISNA